MRWVYISPHFDDAVLSCGGLIWEQAQAGLEVQIWTVCAGFPPTGQLSAFAEQLHRDWDTGTAEQTVRLRREEDRTAASVVGARVRHLSLPDCIYRRSSAGRHYYPEDVFVPPHADEVDALPVEIERRLRGLLHPKDRLVCPLGIGNHIDHFLTRLAAERLGMPLHYYAELPYILNFKDQLAEKTKSMRAMLFPVTEGGLAAWQEGVSVYTSQLAGLFDDDEDMRVSIRAYFEPDAGIWLWQKD